MKPSASSPASFEETALLARRKPMKQTFDTKKKKKMVMGGVIVLSVLTLAGVTLKSRSSLAAPIKTA